MMINENGTVVASHARLNVDVLNILSAGIWNVLKSEGIRGLGCRG